MSRIRLRVRYKFPRTDFSSTSLEEMEKKCDQKFTIVFEAIRQLLVPPDPPKQKIGF